MQKQDVACLRLELPVCWLAEATAHVVERAVAWHGVDTYALLGLADADVSLFAELLRGFLQLSSASTLRCLSGDDAGNCTRLEDEHRLRQWAEHTASDLYDSQLLLILHAPGTVDDVQHQYQRQRLAEAVASLHDTCHKLVLLVLYDPTTLLRLDPIADAFPCFYLQCFGGAQEDADTGTDSMRFVGQPLDRLRDQCGWRMALEIASWASGDDSSTGQPAMFSSMSQLPFQLLMVVLRWGHFHPRFMRVCTKKLHRQMQLIPQSRVQCEIQNLQQREAQLWDGLGLSVPLPVTVALSELPPWSLAASAPDLPSISKLSRLSECELWDTQKRFYQEQGIYAWSSGAIPFGVSSSSFLASRYARIAMDFLLTHVDPIAVSSSSAPETPNCFVWEAASGSCKLLHTFMLHFEELVGIHGDALRHRGLRPLVVASDLSDQVLTSRRQMLCFQPFLQRGQLDFARFDTHDFVHGDPSTCRKKKTLRLEHAQREWRVGSDGPVVLLGNYFLDSLRADVFAVVSRPLDTEDSLGGCVVYEALLPKDTYNIAGMEVHLEEARDPRTQPIYEDSRLNNTLLQVLKCFRAQVTSDEEMETSTQSSGLVLFPVEAMQFFLALLDRDEDMATGTQQQAFPIAILTGDARFSFRDAISSAFVTSVKGSSDPDDEAERVRLELPQLSPHPDCFCLPVDFGILDLFFHQLQNRISGASVQAQVASAPANDTFDVFFATVEPSKPSNPDAVVVDKAADRTRALHMSFQQEFVRFTPGDCDLLWGMMSFDDGARSFSTDSLLALLAQTGWDFDLFSVLQWELLRRWQREQTAAQFDKQIDGVQRYQALLVDAGTKCWRTFYVMDQRAETEVASITAHLQLARWFYQLEANEKVLDVLTAWKQKAHEEDSPSSPVGIYYLLALACSRTRDYWSALGFFRTCARLAPTKLKFQRQVASTLEILQTTRSVPRSINTTEVEILTSI